MNKPQRPITWILVSPFLLVSLILAFLAAVILLLFVHPSVKNRCICTTCKNCGSHRGHHHLQRCFEGGTDWEPGDELVEHKKSEHYHYL